MRQNINLKPVSKNISFHYDESVLTAYGKSVKENLDEFISFSLLQLLQNRDLDLRARRVFYSFTRFNFDIFLNEIPYNNLSNSQQKSCIFEYWLSVIKHLENKYPSKKVILLIDEIDSFLDNQNLVKMLKSLETENVTQIICTSPSEADLSKFRALGEYKIINI